MIFRLADRLVLCPSRDRIAVRHKAKRTIQVDGRTVEIWIERTDGRAPPTILPSVTNQVGPEEVAALDANGNGNGQHVAANGSFPEPQLFVLKFNGAGGRAERTSIHPLDFWSNLPGEVWSPNPPGFGESQGTASLKWLAPVGKAVLEELLAVARGRPIIVTGNSLGTAVALHVCAQFAHLPNLCGLILRNPPPLRELISGKFGWRSLGLARLVAAQIPPQLDSVANAMRVRVPCVFLCAACDRVVPPRFQQLIHTAYAGMKHVVTIPAADHVFELPAPELQRYAQALTWLQAHALAAALPNPQFLIPDPSLTAVSAAFDDCNLPKRGAPAA